MDASAACLWLAHNLPLDRDIVKAYLCLCERYVALCSASAGDLDYIFPFSSIRLGFIVDRICPFSKPLYTQQSACLYLQATVTIIFI